MKRLILLISALLILSAPVQALELVPPDVPVSGERYMPEDTQSFADAVWYIIRAAVQDVMPEISSAASLCVQILAVIMLASVLDRFPGASINAHNLVATVLIGLLLLKPSNTMISYAVETVTELTEYGKLLLPVLTAGLAAQGGVTASTALYTATAFFSTVISSVIKKLIIPLLYSYFCLCIVSASADDPFILNLRNLIKWCISWGLKISLYIFTGFITVTGAVSGAADASAVKAMKVTVSGMIPVVGSIISDASETILVSAGLVKNTAGIYGIVAILAVYIGPFLRIGIQYLILKITTALCAVLDVKQQTAMLKDFGAGVGMILAMTGTVCMILLIGTVCFMKGVT